MEKTRIKVTTVDYYHRDKGMNVTCGLLPNKLNSNRKYFDDPTLNVPIINLNIDVVDSGAGEYQMESLFEYIRQKGWPNGQKPDFVTNKHLLKCIAAGEYDRITVEVVRFDGVIFLLKRSEGYIPCGNFGKVFEHFLTKESDDEEIDETGVVKKAVFVAEVPKKEGSFKVLYSGEIDAIDDHNQHYELKLLSGGANNYFWAYRSCVCYWQCILSNVPLMIVGSRTRKLGYYQKTKEPSNIPEHSLYELETMKVNEMPFTAKKKRVWTVQSGEERLANFLELASSPSIQDGQCYLFSKTKLRSEWKIEEDFDSKFSQFIISCFYDQESVPASKESKYSTMRSIENSPAPFRPIWASSTKSTKSRPSGQTAQFHYHNSRGALLPSAEIIVFLLLLMFSRLLCSLFLSL